MARRDLPIPRDAEARRTFLRLPDRLSLDRWRRLGEQISLLSNSSAWWLGDWLVYGEARFPTRYKQAVTDTGLDYQTLRNYAWVARKFNPERRREGLSFYHHLEVASLPPDEQDAWLRRAERSGWSKTELRMQLRYTKQTRAAIDIPAPPLSLRVTGDRLQRWGQAAENAGMGLTDWLTSVADQAAGGPPES